MDKDVFGESFPFASILNSVIGILIGLLLPAVQIFMPEITRTDIEGWFAGLFGGLV